MIHEAGRRRALSVSTGISFRMTIAPVMRGARRGNPTLRSDDAMSWRLYFLLAALMIVFAFAHILALQKLNAMQSDRPAAIDRLAD